jgi:predicted porin
MHPARSTVRRARWLSALACATGALIALPVAAQSITVYGVMDLYMGSFKGGSTTRKEMADGGNAASRIGFRGTEDLGGGITAEFLAESSILADTGASVTPFWDRQVYVGVGGGRGGKLRLGRQYSPHFIALATSDPFGANAVFSPLGVMFGRDGQTNLVPFPVRLNNMIGYTSPTFSGFTAELAYAPGESAAASKSSGDGYSATLSYRGGPAYVALSASRMRGGSAAAPVASPSSNDFVSLSGSYKLGSLTAYGNWMETTTNAVATNDARHYNLGLSYAFSGQATVSAGYTNREVMNSPKDATVLTLGGDYLLSRRTALYVRTMSVSNKATAANGAARVAVTANSGDDIRAYAVGMRHSF